MNLEIIEEQFKNYYNLFDKSIYLIEYKYNHSYRVMENSIKIANGLKLSDEEVKLATVIGLLHDIGRFKQYTNHQNDVTNDHATLGVKVLFDDKIIEKMNIDKKYYDIIKYSINNHNKLSIDPCYNDKFIMQANILRDSDKIDILYAVSEDLIKLELDDSEISEKVEKKFYLKKLINKKDLKTPNDRLLLFLAFLFDLNYNISLDIINSNKIIEKIFNKVKDKEKFNEYFDFIKKYAKERKTIC